MCCCVQSSADRQTYKQAAAAAAVAGVPAGAEHQAVALRTWALVHYATQQQYQVMLGETAAAVAQHQGHTTSSSCGPSTALFFRTDHQQTDGISGGILQ